MQMRTYTSRYFAAALALALVAFSSLEAQVPDRSGPPELGPPPRLELPPIHELRLSNGLPVMLLEKHTVPLVQVNLLVNAGTVDETRELAGLASMTADMMDEGAGERDALELADAIDFLGASLSVSSGTHTTRVALHTPLSKLERALPIMADVVLRPTFPRDELERKRKSRLTSLLQAHDEPNAIASVAFDRALYGDRHPYGWPDVGDEQSIRSFTVDDLREFHTTHFRPNNATLIVVGDVSVEGILPLLEESFGAWERGDVPERSWPDPEQVDRRQVLLVDKPGAAQSVIRIGRIGVKRRTEDYYAIRVMNTILGGSFTSRLNQNLREDKGYTYGARSSFSFRPMPGPFMAGAAVQTDVTKEALQEFFNELRGILEPVPEAELEGAKNYLAFGFPRGFESVSQIARQLEELVRYDLPHETLTAFVDRVLEVTGDDVLRVARRYVEPERVEIIVVGDRSKIEQGIRELDLGPVRALSVEDVLGPPPEVEGG